MGILHNLATRCNDGLTVSLDYDFYDNQAIVSVKSENEDFTLEPPNDRALDCYYHPFAYANRVLTTGSFAGVRA